MADDVRVETWIAWLDLGVTLRVPETSIPYCDVHESTIRALGAGLYERADSWTAFEAGHGRYGSTDTKNLTLAELRSALVQFASRWPDRVRPRDEDRGATVDAADALALVREGKHCISPWYSSADREKKAAIVGGRGEAYCVTTRGADVIQIERLDPEHDAHLRGLLVSRSSLIDADLARSEAAARHCARREALIAELRGGARKTLNPRDEKRYTKSGLSAAGVVYFVSNHALHVRVMDERELYRDVGYCLLRDEALVASPVDDTTFEQVHALEAKVVALIEALRAGQIAYQRNTSLPTWWVWLDGVPRSFDVRDGRPIALTDDEVEIPSSDCSGYVCTGARADSFHAIDEAFCSAARAIASARAP